MDENGRFLAMRVDLLANMGAYLSQYGPFIPEGGADDARPASTTSRHLYALCRGIYTNTVPVDAYRGAGRPEAAYLVERLVDQCGRDTGLGPIEIRRRNFIRPEQLPYETQGGRIYDRGEFDGHLDRALERRRLEGLRRPRRRGQGQGQDPRHRHRAPMSRPAPSRARRRRRSALNDDGTVTLFIGTQTNGQGHATAYAQFVAGHLGLDYDKIHVVQGDTDQVAERRRHRRLALDPARRASRSTAPR